MPKCNAQTKPPIYLFCDLEKGHAGMHDAPTVAANLRYRWPSEAQIFAEALADLVKIAERRSDG